MLTVTKMRKVELKFFNVRGLMMVKKTESQMGVFKANFLMTQQVKQAEVELRLTQAEAVRL